MPVAAVGAYSASAYAYVHEFIIIIFFVHIVTIYHIARIVFLFFSFLVHIFLLSRTHFFVYLFLFLQNASSADEIVVHSQFMHAHSTHTHTDTHIPHWLLVKWCDSFQREPEILVYIFSFRRPDRDCRHTETSAEIASISRQQQQWEKIKIFGRRADRTSEWRRCGNLWEKMCHTNFGNYHD